MFKPGDTVRVKSTGATRHSSGAGSLERGQEYVVADVLTGAFLGNLVLRNDPLPTGYSWSESRFELVENPTVVPAQDPLHPDDVLIVDPSPVTLRPYDYNAGDVRAFDREVAISVARERTTERGCRQQVRKVDVGADGHLVPSWLIQDI